MTPLGAIPHGHGASRPAEARENGNRSILTGSTADRDQKPWILKSTQDRDAGSDWSEKKLNNELHGLPMCGRSTGWLPEGPLRVQ